MKAILFVFLAACGMTQRPGDILGPGTMCQPLTEFKQRCQDRFGNRSICVERSGRWTCNPE